MKKACTSLPDGAPMHRNAGAGQAAKWLSLAAAPTFAVMALLTAIAGDGADILCAAALNASPPTGMLAMYVLMSVFHTPPWLKLLARSDVSG